MEAVKIKLEDGREIGIEPVAPHEAMTLAEGCRELSGVRQWWGMALVAAAVRSIDGIPVPAPTHEKHIAGVIGRFSKADLQAIRGALDTAEIPPGEKLELSELTPVETLRLWAVIGDYETLPGWVGPAFIAAPVRAIGDEKMMFPASKQDVKSLVKRLGWAGMNDAGEFLLANQTRESAESADKQAAAKN